MAKRPSRAGSKKQGTAVADPIDDSPANCPEDLGETGEGKDPADETETTDEPTAQVSDVQAEKEPTVADVRKMLSDKYPHANAKEVSEQMLVKLAQFPRRVQESPRRKINLNLQMTVETVAWFHELMAHAWPSRRSKK